jgi:hypothetical protein
MFLKIDFNKKPIIIHTMKNSNIAGSIGGLLFTITGCVLLVIKLVTAASFSWWWVWGVMFAPLWIVLGILGCILAIVLAIAIVALPFVIAYGIYKFLKK